MKRGRRADFEGIGGEGDAIRLGGPGSNGDAAVPAARAIPGQHQGDVDTLPITKVNGRRFWNLEFDLGQFIINEQLENNNLP